MKFLIVEDDSDLNDILYDYLKDTFKEALINQVYDGETALELFHENTYDLILLDVMLPGISGFDVCKEVRESNNTPIIMLSALSDDENQIRGYDLGIDEFVKKPYSPKLVIKKVEAVLQRYDTTDNSGLKVYGLLKYDLAKCKVYRDFKELDLNNKEWKLFNLFIHNKGIVLSRDTILNKVWGYEYFGDERTLDTHIKRLRKKLGDTSSYIKTVYRIGYKFEK
ncbi:MAG: response regulator transcription factor [Tenericutes bacterium]|nr:response regulator transcription factor [Mycoplasmatota bacterium]